MEGAAMSLGGSLVAKVRNRRRLASRPSTDVFAGLLKPLIERQDNAVEQSRVSEGYVHVSSLLDFCPRRWRLVQLDKPDLVNAPRSADRVMWMIGRAAEHHVRTSVMKALDWEGVYGRWACLCGIKTHEGFGRPAMICNSCNHPVTVYGELTAWNNEFLIVGNPDLLVREDSKLRVVEIKSMNKREFDLITAPKGNHLFQAACYHRMLADTHEMHPQATIFYVCKDYSFAGSPYKEFSFAASEQYPLVDTMFAQVRMLRMAEANSTLPERLSVCSSPTSSVAKKCVTCVSCFSR